MASKPVSSVQVLSETANVMRQKLGFDVIATRAVINQISQACISVQAITMETLSTALDIADRYGFSHYDSLIVICLKSGLQHPLFRRPAARPNNR